MSSVDRERQLRHLRRVKANVANSEWAGGALSVQVVALACALIASLAAMTIYPVPFGLLSAFLVVLLYRAARRAWEYSGILRTGKPATDRFVARLERDYKRTHGE